MTFDLSSLGWDDAFAGAYAPLDRCDAAPARVLRADLGVCTVMGADGVGRASLGGPVLLGAARDPRRLPCAGDWVVVRRWPDRRHTVEVVLPRRSVLAGPAGADQVGVVAASLAANVDIIAVVESEHPTPNLDRLECLTVAAASGLPVLAVSEYHGAGIDALRELVPPGRTLALLGGAGSGRSALVNALAGVTTLPARSISPSGSGGSVRRPAARPALVPVPGGGAVVDVPAEEGDQQGIGAPVRLAAVAGTGDARRRPRR